MNDNWVWIKLTSLLSSCSQWLIHTYKDHCDESQAFHYANMMLEARNNETLKEDHLQAVASDLHYKSLILWFLNNVVMGAGWKEIKVFEHSQGTPVIKRLKDLSDSLFTMLNEKQKQRMMFTHRIIKCISLAKSTLSTVVMRNCFLTKLSACKLLAGSFR
jgi:hypothetical protein